MTVDTFPGRPAYTIAGTGPYPVNHEYTIGAIRPFVMVAGAQTYLDGADFTISPASGPSGNVTLSTGAAQTHAGAQLYLERDTPTEQGWVGTQAREKGLEGQLDRLTQAIQDNDACRGRSLRVLSGDLPPLVPSDQKTIYWDAGAGAFAVGPSITDIALAGPNAATAATAAAAAAASAAAAALFDGPKFDTLTLASAYTSFTSGQLFVVWAGFNGEPETFKYVSDSTLTANGALVLASAMATGRLISTRTTYANFAEMDADARPLASGVTLSIPGVAEYNRVTTGEHLTLASGFKVKARIGADGFGPGIFGIIGDLSVDETAKMQAMVDAWDAMDDKGVIYMGNARVLIAGSILLSNRLVMRDGDGDIAAVQNKPIMKFIGGTFVKRNAGFIFDKKRVADDSVLDGYDAADFTFTGTAFEGNSSVGGMYAFNADNIIQVGLIGTTGTQMGLAKSAATVDMSGDDWSGYLQSYSQSESCTWVGQAGYLVDVGILYALELHGKNQQGDAVLKTRSNASDPACNGLSVMGTIQGCSGAAGPAISVGACYASTIGPKLYLEANAGGDIDTSLGGTVLHKGLSFIGIGAQPTPAQVANADYYAIRVGRTASGALISGCYSTSNLAHIPTNNDGDISFVGSGAATGKKIVNADARRYLLVSGGVVESVSTASARIGLFAGFSEIFWGGLTETVDGVEVPISLSWGEQSPAASPGSFAKTKFATGSRVFKPTITTVTIKNSYNQDEAVWLQGWTCIGGHDTSDTDVADMWVPDYGTKAYVAP